MLIFGITFPVLSIIFLIGVVIYKKNENKPKKRKVTNENSEYEKSDYEKKLDKNELKKLINIKEIKNNKVYLRNGAVRVNLAISSPDYELLTDDEQTTFENCLIMSELAFNSSTMFYTSLKKMEIKRSI